MTVPLGSRAGNPLLQAAMIKTITITREPQQGHPDKVSVTVDHASPMDALNMLLAAIKMLAMQQGFDQKPTNPEGT